MQLLAAPGRFCRLRVYWGLLSARMFIPDSRITGGPVSLTDYTTIENGGTERTRTSTPKHYHLKVACTANFTTVPLNFGVEGLEPPRISLLLPKQTRYQATVYTPSKWLPVRVTLPVGLSTRRLQRLLALYETTWQ